MNQANQPTRVAVVGAGWAGATCARELHDLGVDVTIFERSTVVGGHSRAETLDGVVYEPNGAHIFHTSDAEVAAYAQRFGLSRTYEHRVLTEVFLSEDDEDHESLMLSWPPQISELKTLPIWPTIEAELAELPAEPHGDDFETYVSSMMGETLYNLFIAGYTAKQWGRPANELSASFAPKRVELRDDGYTRLFRDTWEFFPSGGVNSVIEAITAPIETVFNTTVSLADLDDLATRFDHVVITAPLDEFAGRPDELAWRGISMDTEVIDVDETRDTATSAYVVNRPSLRVPWTRTIETKHATGQQINKTVVSKELPGSAARHYPVATVDGRYEAINHDLKRHIAEAAPLPVSFCGRLANYTYINQDEAIRQGLAAARTLLGD